MRNALATARRRAARRVWRGRACSTAVVLYDAYGRTGVEPPGRRTKPRRFERVSAILTARFGGQGADGPNRIDFRIIDYIPNGRTNVYAIKSTKRTGKLPPKRTRDPLAEGSALIRPFRSLLDHLQDVFLYGIFTINTY